MRSFIHDELYAIQYQSDEIVDLKKSNTGIISGIVLSADPDAIPDINITHSDTADGEFEPLIDKFAFSDDYQQDIFVGGSYAYVNMDLRGCKRFARFEVKFKNKKTGEDAVADWKMVFVRDTVNSVNISTL